MYFFQQIENETVSGLRFLLNRQTDPKEFPWIQLTEPRLCDTFALARPRRDLGILLEGSGKRAENEVFLESSGPGFGFSGYCSFLAFLKVPLKIMCYSLSKSK